MVVDEVDDNTSMPEIMSEIETKTTTIETDDALEIPAVGSIYILLTLASLQIHKSAAHFINIQIPSKISLFCPPTGIPIANLFKSH
jgi:hypothetical protein